MNNTTERFRTLRSWSWWRWAITGLSLLATLLSLSLSWHYLSGDSMTGCSGGSPCDLVLSSKWSMLGGMIPVSSLAVGVYLALLVASFFIGPDTDAPVRRLAWKALLLFSGAVTGSALWFIIVQKWYIGAFCPYCMSTHLSGLLLAVFVVSRAHPFRPLHKFGLLLLGLGLAGVLVAFQIGMSPDSVYKDGNSQETLPTMDYSKVPMMGSADAPNVVTLLYDYKCPHCQKLHFMLQEAVRRYGGQLSVVLCPTPLNTGCNPYVPRDVEAFKDACELAKISLAVWKVNQTLFPEFENWLFTYESGDRWQPRTLEAANAKAREWVGAEKLDAALADPWIGQYLQTCVGIFGQTLQNGKGGIPKLIFDARWVIPEPANTEALITILQSSLGLPPILQSI